MAETAERNGAMRAFYMHLAAYLAVNLVLAIVNLSQAPAGGEPREYWFLWPLAGWGIGVAAHGLALWLKRLGAAQDSLFAEKEVRGAAVHFFVYLAVNALLIAVNLVATPNSIWFFFPLIGWGIGLAFHAWRVYRTLLRRTVEHYALEQRLIGEISLERRAAEITAAIVPGISRPDEKEGESGSQEKRPAPAKKRKAARTVKPAKTASKKSKSAARKIAAKKPAGPKRSAAKGARPKSAAKPSTTG